MKDTKLVVGFVLGGLILAFAFSGPLRRSAKETPSVGTPLHDHDAVYAEGTIDIDPAMKEKRGGGASVLFVIVRAKGGGPPMAVKKYSPVTVPLQFSITEADNMVGDEFYEGDIEIVARLDKDGVAGPKEADDVEGVVKIEKGSSRAVRIVLGGQGL